MGAFSNLGTGGFRKPDATNKRRVQTSGNPSTGAFGRKAPTLPAAPTQAPGLDQSGKFIQPKHTRPNT